VNQFCRDRGVVAGSKLQLKFAQPIKHREDKCMVQSQCFKMHKCLLKIKCSASSYFHCTHSIKA